MRLTRRDFARLSGAAVASSCLASNSLGDVARAQTPEAGSGDSLQNAALLSLLRFVPLSLVGENYTDGFELASFGDGALRLATVGVEVPEVATDTEDYRSMFQATMPVPYGDLVSASVRADDSLSLFGWTIPDVHQSLFTRSSVGLIHVMRGSFDFAALTTAWSTNGYQMLEVEGYAVASRSEEQDLDLSTEIDRLTLGGVNNAVLVDDGTLLYSPTLAGLTTMLQAHDETTLSLATHDIVEAVVGAIAYPLSGASLLPGPALMAPIPLNLGEATVPDLEELPEPGPVSLMALIGFVSGPAVPAQTTDDVDAQPTPSGSMMIASLKYASPEEAAIAAKRAFLQLETGSGPTTEIPYAERFAGWRVDHYVDSDILIVEIDLYGDEAVWLEMIYNRDAGFLYS